MNRQQKKLVVKTLQESFVNSQTLFVVGYRGLTVVQIQTLRDHLREKNGNMTVAKVRLMKRAVEGMEKAEELREFFKNQIALIFASKESSAIAKILYNFSKQHEALQLIAGYLDSRLLDKNTVIRIALLPSREVLLGQVCGAIRAPIYGFVSLLSMHILRFLITLKQIEEKKRV